MKTITDVDKDKDKDKDMDAVEGANRACYLPPGAAYCSTHSLT
jgi:hypothetical protein